MDKSEIYKWWKIFKDEEDLVEIRILGKKTFSGYYKDVEKLISDIERFDSDPDEQIYYTLNYINDACYARAQNERLIMSPKSTTTDGDIVGRKWVLVDLDPKRATSVNSSAEELHAAHLKAVDIYRFLLDNGFNEPVVCCSGNGYHINIPCKIGVSNDTDVLLKRFLLALSMLFSDEKVEVDEKVFNRARISKLYGTTAKKGANVPDRPYRVSKILKYPAEIKPNDISYFEKIAKMYPEEEVRPDAVNHFSREKFDLVSFLNKYGIQYRTESVAGGTKYVLNHCVFNESHKGKDAVIFQRDNGAISYVCLHNSCSHYTWKDVRLKFEPDAYDKRDYQEYQFKQKYYSPQRPFVPQKETEEKGKKWLSFKDFKMANMSDAVAIPSGFTYLDKAIKGFLIGEITILSGINGSGKSSWLDMVMINAIQRGFKVACWSGELTKENLKTWIYLPTAGKRYSIKDPNYDNVYTVDEKVEPKIDVWFDGKFFLFNNEYGNDFEQIISDMEEIIDACHTSLLVLDNMMALNIDGNKGDKNEKQKEFILRIVALAKRKQVHIIVVMHPRKEMGNTFLRKESISGSGDLSNAAQNIFIIHRVGEDFVKRAGDFFGKQKLEKYTEYDNVLECCKNRSFGVVDYLVGMYFEPESKRFKNYQSEYIHYGWEENPVQQTIYYDQQNKQQKYQDMPFSPADGEAPF